LSIWIKCKSLKVGVLFVQEAILGRSTMRSPLHSKMRLCPSDEEQ